MKRSYFTTTLSFLLCGFLMLASCGSSTGPGDDDGEEPGSEAPTAPANLSGSSGDQEIELAWDANSESNISGYNIYRSTSSFDNASEVDPVNNGQQVSGEAYTDTEVENGTTYYYRITAVNTSDTESEVSSELEITPFSNPPDHPDE